MVCKSLFNLLKQLSSISVLWTRNCNWPDYKRLFTQGYSMPGVNTDGYEKEGLLFSTSRWRDGIFETFQDSPGSKIVGNVMKLLPPPLPVVFFKALQGDTFLSMSGKMCMLWAFPQLQFPGGTKIILCPPPPPPVLQCFLKTKTNPPNTFSV